ncbi:MAG TPA: phage holin family protein [Verrucomicrobiae bacterium]|nr:phage holin family protein [Verrucomicrobiae bacterium]
MANVKDPSIAGLFSEARRSTQTFIHEEIELAKAEFSEKAIRYREAMARAGAGAFILYGAVIVLLTGLGWLASFLFQTLGLDSMPARTAGFGSVGILVIIVGSLVLLKGISALSRTSVVPEKTLDTLPHFKGLQAQSRAATGQPGGSRRAAKQIESEIVATEERLGKHLEALAGRLSPTRYLRAASIRVKANPVRWNLAALASGFAGSVWFVRKLRKSFD